MRLADFDVSFCLDYKVSPLHEDANRAARTGDMEVSQNMLMQKLMVKIKQQKKQQFAKHLPQYLDLSSLSNL